MEAHGSKSRRKITRKRQQKDGSPWPIALLLVGVIGFSMWFVGTKVYGAVLYQLVRNHQVDYGTVEKILPIENALLIREETVTTAPHGGTVIYAVLEGQRVAEGDTVVRLQSDIEGVRDIKASQAGIVCYHFDGLENTLTPQGADQLRLGGIDAKFFSLKEIPQGTLVEKGQPVFKLVNNLAPFLLWLEFDVAHLENFPSTGKRLQFRVGKEEYEGVITKLETQGVRALGILQLDRGELLHQRQMDLELVLQQEQGLVIPNEALMSFDEDGVFKKTAKNYRWVPVTVKLTNGEISVVEGLSRGDYVVLNPSLLKSRIKNVSQ